MSSKRRTKRSTEDQGRRPQDAQRAMPAPHHPHLPRYPLQQQTDGEAGVDSQHSARFGLSWKFANLQFWSFFSLRSGWFNFLTLFFVIHENHPKDQTFVHSSPQTPFLHAFFSHQYSSPGHGMFPRLSVALPRLLPRLQALRRRPLRAL